MLESIKEIYGHINRNSATEREIAEE